MSTKKRGRRRGELPPAVQELMRTGREMSAATVMFHSAVAEHAGLSATEHKALDILSRAGPLTAGELAEHTGLTTGAITGLIDRLEAADFVRRVRDPDDRRKVIVEPVLEVLQALIGPIFEEMGRAVAELYASYGERERQILLDYQQRMTALLHEEITRLRGGGSRFEEGGGSDQS
jgi:DNA-binding MarR family transcriptional regulator